MGHLYYSHLCVLEAAIVLCVELLWLVLCVSILWLQVSWSQPLVGSMGLLGALQGMVEGLGLLVGCGVGLLGGVLVDLGL